MIEPQETRVIDGKTFLRVEPDVAYMPVPRCDTCLLWGDGWPNFGKNIFDSPSLGGQDPPAADHSVRLWSLWGLMNKFNAKLILKRLGEFAFAECALRPEMSAPAAMQEKFRKALLGAIPELLAADMKDAAVELERLAKTAEIRVPAAVSADACTARYAIIREFDKRTFLYVRPHLVQFVDNAALFGEEVNVAFPAAVSDLVDAGNCVAVECGTAAVFHLMRVVEHGLRAVANSLKIELTNKGTPQLVEYADWNDVITAVRNRIAETRRKSRGPDREAALVFYSQVADQCEYMKDMWRNAIAHTRGPYNLDEALGVMQRVKALMVRLATDLPKYTEAGDS